MNAQDSDKENKFSNSEFLAFFGLGQHGTGDLPGYSYGLHLNTLMGESQLFWIIGFEGSLHNQKQLPFYFDDSNGEEFDGTLNDVTGGFQLSMGLGIDFLQSKKNSLSISLNPLIRYQSTSINYYQEIQYPALTGYPMPIRIIYNKEDQTTIAVGGALQLAYDHYLSKTIFLGAMGSFQMDTNEDTLYYAAFRIGRRF